MRGGKGSLLSIIWGLDENPRLVLDGRTGAGRFNIFVFVINVKQAFAVAVIGCPFVMMMRLQNAKRGAQQKPVVDRNLVGEKVNSEFSNMACCRAESVNGGKDPIVVSSVKTEVFGKATMEGHVEEDEIISSLDGCVGEGILTQSLYVGHLKIISNAAGNEGLGKWSCRVVIYDHQGNFVASTILAMVEGKELHEHVEVKDVDG